VVSMPFICLQIFAQTNWQTKQKSIETTIDASLVRAAQRDCVASLVQSSRAIQNPAWIADKSNSKKKKRKAPSCLARSLISKAKSNSTKKNNSQMGGPRVSLVHSCTRTWYTRFWTLKSLRAKFAYYFFRFSFFFMAVVEMQRSNKKG